MARWLLTQPHYLNIPGTKWRYDEVSQATGEMVSQEFAVPRLLDPNNPRDCRSPEGCVVTTGTPSRGDWAFIGEPTPDMDPLDDEAEAISLSLRPKWQHPIESLPANGEGFSTAILALLEKQLTEASRTAVPNTAVTGVSKEEFVTLQEQVAALMARNAELEAAQAPNSRRA